METKSILEVVWALLNTPAVITAIAGLFIYALNKLYASKPGWQKWEGTIMSAIKYAEKNLPDDTTNGSLAKLNAALNYTLNVYEETTGKRATPKVKADLKEGIQITHGKLEVNGTLTKND